MTLKIILTNENNYKYKVENTLAVAISFALE